MTLTLKSMGASTIYFSDRPKREVGHMTSARFVEYWDEGDNSFQSDPPNAVLSYTDGHPGAPLEDAVITINDPRLEGDTLTYSYTLMDGTDPNLQGRSSSSSTRWAGPCRRGRWPASDDVSAAAASLRTGGLPMHPA